MPLFKRSLSVNISSSVEKSLQQRCLFSSKDRFNRAMRDNADLQDRTQQLEHLILQLQSETETIGKARRFCSASERCAW